jgi:hypothetical protein
MSKPFGTYDYIPRARKVKHVKFFKTTSFVSNLERDINKFADDNPSFKILGVRLETFGEELIAVVTYLEDAKTGFTGEEDDYGADEETDLD